jgi:hypothetical protein
MINKTENQEKRNKRKNNEYIKQYIKETYPSTKSRCINCHFLCDKETGLRDNEITHEKRLFFDDDDYESLNAGHYLACFFGEWNESLEPQFHKSELVGEREKRLRNILFGKKRRKYFFRKKCCYWEYRPGINFEKGKKYRDSERDRFYTKWALIVAVSALVINMILIF